MYMHYSVSWASENAHNIPQTVEGGRCVYEKRRALWFIFFD